MAHGGISDQRDPGAALGVVLTYVRAEFRRPDGQVISLDLSVLVTQNKDGWQIAHYQVSHVS